MFYYFIEFLEQLKPKIFLFENVKGLTYNNKGKTLLTIKNSFEDAGYKLYSKVLNSWNYGVPQKRERFFIVGIRDDLDIEFNFPEEQEYKPVLRDVLTEDIRDGEGSEYLEKTQELFKSISPCGCHREIEDRDLVRKHVGEKIWASRVGRGVLRRFSMDEPALTVMTTAYQNIADRCHPVEERPFNIRESARIQSFPNDWVFKGSVSAQYTQIGNAVPVKLAEAIGLEIVKIDWEKTEKNTAITISLLLVIVILVVGYEFNLFGNIIYWLCSLPLIIFAVVIIWTA